MDITLPSFVEGLHPEVEGLMFAYGRCMRRAYSMKWKAIRRGLKPDRLGAIRQLTADERVPARYVVVAYDRADALPAHVTFGGKRLQKLIMAGRISREGYRLRRNSILVCRGEKAQKGNLCLRVEEGGRILRVAVGERQWIRLPLQLPEKYLMRYGAFLDGSKPYTVLLKRRLDGRGYDARITVYVEEPAAAEPKRLMPLDINSGHVDFAIADKQTLKPITFGKVNCHQLLDAGKGKNELLTYRLVNKVKNIAEHYDAEVVAGKLRTLTSKKNRHANRRVHRMSQYRIRQVMAYKLPLSGVRYLERSEAHTSKLGRALSKPLGLDVHKASAYAFAFKVTDYESFTKFLRGERIYDGVGILNAHRSGGKQANRLTSAVHGGTGVPFKAYGLRSLRVFGATSQCKGWDGRRRTPLTRAPILQVEV